jgi:hypothetical protein
MVWPEFGLDAPLMIRNAQIGEFAADYIELWRDFQDGFHQQKGTNRDEERLKQEQSRTTSEQQSDENPVEVITEKSRPDTAHPHSILLPHKSEATLTNHKSEATLANHKSEANLRPHRSEAHLGRYKSDATLASQDSVVEYIE